MLLKLINNLTKKVTFLDNLNENLNSSDLFYCFTINLPAGMQDGEYTYNLYDDSYLVVSGVLQIGDYTQDRTVYNNENNYVVYG